jgi:mRNA-degrading endonuclease toxin of MazEF toxin-antitoxin module
VSTLEQGRIIWAELPSSDGTTKKRRPAVVVTPTAEIVPGKPFAVVTATTKFTEPLPADQIHLPWQPEGKVRTQLRQPTVAVCSWVGKILETDVLQYGGVVPPKVMVEIIKIVKQQPAE